MFFASQSLTAVAETDSGVAGLYILHPNNIGRCGHIANASYAAARVPGASRLVNSWSGTPWTWPGNWAFGIMQFNAVVAINAPALHTL